MNLKPIGFVILLLLFPGPGRFTFAADNGVSVIDLEVEVRDPRFHRFLNLPVSARVLATDLGWAEGPVWVESLQSLLFSDVAADKVYRWHEIDGLQEYLHPSGHQPDNAGSAWRGSNGLAIDAEGRLLLAQQSARRIARMSAPLNQPRAEFEILSSRFRQRSLNSPNDLVMGEGGDIYFTDPPYGLAGFENSPERELDFFGVFRLSVDNELETLSTDLSKPNGIALTADQSKLYVSNSEKGAAGIYSFDLAVGPGSKAKLFFDARNLEATGAGSTDGMALHKSQNLFASVPGGVALISKSGSLLGIISLGQVTNMAFDQCYCYLYVTTPNRLLRIPLNTDGNWSD